MTVQELYDRLGPWLKTHAGCPVKAEIMVWVERDPRWENRAVVGIEETTEGGGDLALLLTTK